MSSPLLEFGTKVLSWVLSPRVSTRVFSDYIYKRVSIVPPILYESLGSFLSFFVSTSNLLYKRVSLSFGGQSFLKFPLKFSPSFFPIRDSLKARRIIVDFLLFF